MFSPVRDENTSTRGACPARRIAEVRASLRRTPVVALPGPYQCGKSTLVIDVVVATDDEDTLARIVGPRAAGPVDHGGAGDGESREGTGAATT